MATRRIKKELGEYKKYAHSNISISCNECDVYNWSATVLGPPNSPYESGIFFLDIKFPSDYPFKPPEIKFSTKIFHLNINENGNICCDCNPFLYMNWSPSHTVIKVLNYVYELLIQPDPNCIFNFHTTFGSDREKYEKTAKEWTRKYADGVEEVDNSNSAPENSATESNIEFTPENQNELFPTIENNIESASENQNELVTTIENNIESASENQNELVTTTENNNQSVPENQNELVPTEQPSVSTSRQSASFQDILPEEQPAVSTSNRPSAFREIFINYYKERLHLDFTFKIEFCDCYFPLKCHKLVMSMRSAFFADKMFGENQESNDEMIISDVSPSAFELLIEYCYEIVKIENVSNVKLLVEVHQAAKRYAVTTLETSCIKSFSFMRPSVHNVAEFLDAAILLDLIPLKLRCIKILQDSTAEILSPTDMSSITTAIVDAVLDQEELSLESEYDLLCQVFKWGRYIQEQEKNKSLRDVVEPYFPKMRFLRLVPDQFGSLVNDNPQCFTDAEISAIFMNIACPESRALPLWCNSINVSRYFFNRVPTCLKKSLRRPYFKKIYKAPLKRP